MTNEHVNGIIRTKEGVQNSQNRPTSRRSSKTLPLPEYKNMNCVVYNNKQPPLPPFLSFLPAI